MLWGGGDAAPAPQPAGANGAAAGCEWVSRRAEHMRLPEFPSMPGELEWRLPAVPRLLPPSERLQDLVGYHLEVPLDTTIQMVSVRGGGSRGGGRRGWRRLGRGACNGQRRSAWASLSASRSPVRLSPASLSRGGGGEGGGKPASRSGGRRSREGATAMLPTNRWGAAAVVPRWATWVRGVYVYIYRYITEVRGTELRR